MPAPLAERPTPQSLMQMHMAMIPARALTAAIQLDLFSKIADGHHTADAIATAAGANTRGTRMVLDALCTLGLLQKTALSYALPAETRAYLLPASPDYIGGFLAADEFWNSWGHLTEAVRTGKPFLGVESQERAEAFFPILVRSLHVLNREPARRLAAALGAGTTHRGARVLDVACGSAVWGIAVAEADPEARVTAQDFPGVLPTTQEFARRHGLADRFDYLPGNLRQVDYGTSRFDLAILGNIVHSEGEHASRQLFRSLFAALAPQGRLIIIDMIPDEERTAPPYPVLFALNMLLHTEEGDTFTLAQYRDWLTDAGFTTITTAEIGQPPAWPFPAIIATKPSA